MKKHAAIAMLAAGACLNAASPPTFSADVWPILKTRCVNCHSAGAIGPMPLTSYQQARPWARAIREAVLSRTMPPWHAVPVGRHVFRNDRSLSAAEVDTIVSWVDGGAPEGQPVSEYAAVPQDRSWKLGRPDLVIQVPGFAVPKSGQVPYSFLIVPLHFEHDTWIRAAEFLIDQRALIHHINAFIRPH